MYGMHFRSTHWFRYEYNTVLWQFIQLTKPGGHSLADKPAFSLVLIVLVGMDWTIITRDRSLQLVVKRCVPPTPLFPASEQ